MDEVRRRIGSFKWRLIKLGEDYGDVGDDEDSIKMSLLVEMQKQRIMVNFKVPQMSTTSVIRLSGSIAGKHHNPSWRLLISYQGTVIHKNPSSTLRTCQHNTAKYFDIRSKWLNWTYWHTYLFPIFGSTQVFRFGTVIPNTIAANAMADPPLPQREG